MKIILVPLDGSPLAEQVMPYVRSLAPLLGSRVHLLHGISEAQQEKRFAEADASAIASPVCAQCTLMMRCNHTDCYIAEQATLLRAAGVEAYADTRVGAPADAIVAAADRWPDTLIAMATHGRSGLRRWALGSVADQVLHATTIPLLLVRGADTVHRPRLDPALKRILVPLDGSALARQALRLALELAVRAQAELILVQVAAPSIEEFLCAVPAAADVRSQLHDQAVQAFAALADDLPRAQVRLSTAVALGPTAAAIAEEADRRRVDLIVMATHGYSGIQRWRLGSVADTLLQTTTTPLLLVRTQDSATTS